MAETLQRDEIVVRDIIDTARVLFKKSGFKKTTMGDIARSLGKAKSSLYYYYPSKEDIFEAVLHSEMDELLKQIHQSIRHAATSKEKLTIYCRCRLIKLNELCNLSDALKSEIGELHELHCIMTDLKRQFDTTHVGLVREILEEGVSNGEFKKINEGQYRIGRLPDGQQFQGTGSPFDGLPKPKPQAGPADRLYRRHYG
jgi:AcrR family transcriptional regulator